MCYIYLHIYTLIIYIYYVYIYRFIYLFICLYSIYIYIFIYIYLFIYIYIYLQALDFWVINVTIKSDNSLWKQDLSITLWKQVLLYFCLYIFNVKKSK